ncbi:MAG: imidazole glycerol phosphate synthase subunit HisH [Aestuariivita sp.]|nr:imidazole glycerol phosphate synthase subunit HisH [Aestuariivita sp.]MCY4203725.1 imidazole glycerol phosphate synthase subunit HisH [Aestuariivita sp.]MCY4289102.1 imidazole glycerol phosphate synthase subunit HisH [Aestuariivita sp.]MCY4347702.1 imidazole glycerol phosphate synthase subunit HisH [Aestuariivita sp.]
MFTAIVDLESGNLHSAVKAFERVTRETRSEKVAIVSDPRDLTQASRIVLPGDGSFPNCMGALSRQTDLFETMAELVKKDGRPFLGICIGMQLLASKGHEFHAVSGLDWIPGEVEKIRPDDQQLKVPHMGWNDLIIDHPHAVIDGIDKGDHAYFVHSYQFRTAEPRHCIAHVDYGGAVTAIVAHDNLVGTQFHPEKSQKTGLRLIANFLQWSP